MKSVNVEVLCVMEDTETEAAQCKRKVYTVYTPEQRASIGAVIVMYQHV